MTIPEAAAKAGISKPTAYKRINQALQEEGLKIQDVIDIKTKHILDDRLTWVEALFVKKPAVKSKVNTKNEHDLTVKLTEAREEILHLQEKLTAAEKQIERLRQHEDLLIKQNAAQTITINRITEERLHLAAGNPAEELQTFGQRLRWLISGNGKKGKE